MRAKPTQEEQEAFKRWYKRFCAEVEALANSAAEQLPPAESTLRMVHGILLTCDPVLLEAMQKNSLNFAEVSLAYLNIKEQKAR